MKMLGSMAPPRVVGHTKADDESSTNGPAGFALVAREMHIALETPLTVCTQPVDDGFAKQMSGIVAGVV